MVYHLAEIKCRLWACQFRDTGNERAFQRLWEQVKNLEHPNYSEFPEFDINHWNSIKQTALLEAVTEYSSKHVVVQQRFLEIPKGIEIVKVKKVIHIARKTIVDGEVILTTEPKVVRVYEARQKKVVRVVKVKRQSEMTIISFIRMKMGNAIKAEIRRLYKARQDVRLEESYRDDPDTSVAEGIMFHRLRDKAILNPIDADTKEGEFRALIAAIESRLEETGEHKLLTAFRLKLGNPGIRNRRIATRMGVSKTHTSNNFRRLRKIIEEVIQQTDFSYR